MRLSRRSFLKRIMLFFGGAVAAIMVPKISSAKPPVISDENFQIVKFEKYKPDMLPYIDAVRGYAVHKDGREKAFNFAIEKDWTAKKILEIARKDCRWAFSLDRPK
jgi:hypothetical protein